MTADHLSTLKDLFVNRSDCYCIQLSSGGYSKIPKALTDQKLQEHLDGKTTIGTYQLDQNSLVKCSCFDLDPETLPNPQATAKQILEALRERVEDEDGNKSPRIHDSSIILEASRYPDPSYHIWILFLVPVKAKVARWIALRLLEIANLNPKQVEIFPKQNEVTPERPYGNFVKLPFGKHQVEGKWSRMLDLNTFEPLPIEELENKHGLSFSEADMQKLEKMETQKSVQIAFETPKITKKLCNQDQENTVSALLKYWKQGYRNDLTMSFCGMCIKEGITHQSARQVIEELCKRTNTPNSETAEFLSTVDYQFNHRANISNLKGSSGIREVIEAINAGAKKQ